MTTSDPLGRKLEALEERVAAAKARESKVNSERYAAVRSLQVAGNS